ncbi:hypothetical protein AN478_06045 [Thiohalorhabdus denitrificans]|uniref:Uncharacterized protein n=1 Tax=Thiohalorhabdus denitrificans TaxID=381306 RepID=A0A0P9CVM9_9GAMM|nr:hypothetical protein [Thiohalorhabdus denitrificans]KPV40715.1 hypothetical protein AN478_06045 [Thiohalorhabdus denitrificans]SCY46188.1 hypothetical protein SAMN05661077_2168 [Thiohalorhabdus denitrificans]
MSSPDAQPTPAEIEERERLAEVKSRLQRALGALDSYAREIQELKEYLWDSRGDMDHAEKVAAREQVQQSVRTGELTPFVQDG